MAGNKRSVCPVACALDVIGDKWTLLVIRDMACGKQHFNEFCRSPEGIATNILAARLEKLLAHGLAEKSAAADSTGRDVYRLTDKGKSLSGVMTAIAEWGLQNIKGTKAHLKPSFE